MHRDSATLVRVSPVPVPISILSLPVPLPSAVGTLRDIHITSHSRDRWRSPVPHSIPVVPIVSPTITMSVLCGAAVVVPVTIIAPVTVAVAVIRGGRAAAWRGRA